MKTDIYIPRGANLGACRVRISEDDTMGDRRVLVEFKPGETTLSVALTPEGVAALAEALGDYAGNEMTIGALMRTAHEDACEKGWRDEPRSIPEDLCLIHSEVSEALESYRAGEPHYWIRTEGEKAGKPEGVLAEAADIVIRVCEVTQHHGWDLEQAIREKQEYNRSRPYRHGGKKL